MQARYSFQSSDSLAQFGAWVIYGHLLFLLPLLPWLFKWAGWSGMSAVLLLGALHIAGLRASIRVGADGVVIVKKWFFIPYKRYRAPAITDVWYGGDWGLEEGSICLVVKLGDQEVTLGTSKNMCDLHAALMPFVSSNNDRGGNT